MRFLIIGFVALFASNTFAAEAVIHSATTSPLNSRYEIVSSTILARHTYRLDKFCGYIAQLVLISNGDNAWSNMPVQDLPRCQGDKPRYQLFTSGIAAKHTYLINVDTGRTWQIMGFKNSSGNEDTGWFPIN